MTQKKKLQNNDALKRQTRSLQLTEIETDETDNRIKTFSFSSEEPIPSGFGIEILSHETGCVDLARLNNASPFLFNHNRDDLLGVIEKAWIGSNKKGYVTVRFGKDERGVWANAQVDDKILVNASVSYDVTKYLYDENTDTYTAIRWEPYEVSLVTIPADITVGVGRSENATEHTVTVEVKHNPNQSTKEGKTMPEAKTPDEIIAAERSRVKEIDTMCRSHNMPTEKREKLIHDGISIDMARGLILEELSTRGQAQSLANGYAPDLSDKEKRAYSMVAAINACVERDWKGAGLEREISQDIAKRTGKESTGFYMPTNLGNNGWSGSRAGYEVGTVGQGTSGGTLVAQNLLAGDFIEALRNQAKVIQSGARVLSGLVGGVTIPRQSSQSTAFWITEGQAVGEGEATFDSITLSPRTIGTKSLISRNMLLQSTPDIEMLARADFIKVIALGIELAALSGTGGAQPTGIANTSGVNAIVGGTNGAALTIDHLIAMEAAIFDANAPEDTLAYLANAKTVGALKTLKSTTGQYLWTNSPTGGRSGTPGEINGYEVYRTNQARKTLTKGTQDGTTAAKMCSELFFGAWSELLIGEWGVVEILPNPYGKAYESGGVELRILQTVDIGIRHAQSFAYMNDAVVLA